ncbi:methyltransferase domain-containing protein [Candidatus Woesearchaeota archaeon]|nr:MAG: hypothetical protein QS99_C0002G0114 [archaeon GW2011_AR4]MBS3129104.1 methyltransferase domain-containing protein [Candidatus Woesearchaeota archaeon]HIH37836.1 class I SAM-dependent methyltransferase [Candidatus Woesearchaeota archaeon]HIH49268.1 class I SAM-dependent methyltransferase [Candidatus Woesearchaeota archaeon]HIJ03961.1 class I SAM-dependent methyltransferase [Candidatus Woesearchaeota archaeon]
MAYSKRFYLALHEGSIRSAREVAPIIHSLLKGKSVADVGCGVGSWLLAFQEQGIHDYLGIDHPRVQKEIIIPPEKFYPHDLTRPLRLNRKFDIAISLEVAEHLPKTAASIFVETLTRLSDQIVFSAAIPHSGGHHHINEQWPTYWAALFKKRGYLVIDPFRRALWNNENVEWWYAQNMLCFIKKSLLEKNEKLSREKALTFESQISLVHPKRYLVLAKPVELVKRIVPYPIRKAAHKIIERIVK